MYCCVKWALVTKQLRITDLRSCEVLGLEIICSSEFIVFRVQRQVWGQKSVSLLRWLLLQAILQEALSSGHSAASLGSSYDSHDRLCESYSWLFYLAFSAVLCCRRWRTKEEGQPCFGWSKWQMLLGLGLFSVHFSVVWRRLSLELRLEGKRFLTDLRNSVIFILPV